MDVARKRPGAWRPTGGWGNVCGRCNRRRRAALVRASPFGSVAWRLGAPVTAATSADFRLHEQASRFGASERGGGSMEVVVERCAGLDVHKDVVVACIREPVPGGERVSAFAEFGAFTQDVLALRDWLVAHRVTRVGMEATGVYWKPVFYVLEEVVECWLLNARHLRNVPGRKTDMQDSAWICQLLEHGLVRASFVPPKPIRELRDLTRYRKTQIEERSREVQRLDKVLQDAGIKLSSVASKTLGVSVRAMLEAMLRGTHDPKLLAQLAKGRLRAKLPALDEALLG